MVRCFHGKLGLVILFAITSCVQPVPDAYDGETYKGQQQQAANNSTHVADNDSSVNYQHPAKYNDNQTLSPYQSSKIKLRQQSYVVSYDDGSDYDNTNDYQKKQLFINDHENVHNPYPIDNDGDYRQQQSSWSEDDIELDRASQSAHMTNYQAAYRAGYEAAKREDFPTLRNKRTTENRQKYVIKRQNSSPISVPQEPKSDFSSLYDH